jgi:threonine dehydrogenase-like Zn-dependent dehydrogenase
MTAIPQTQYAVQLVAGDELKFNDSKPVYKPKPNQILCKVNCVGLCFSDLKLLKHFTKHPRKTPVLSGIDEKVLNKLPSYVPNEKPAVPGHESVVTIVQVGEEVSDFYKVGEKYLVQADYRWLKTKDANGAFGYNFEGALQEYVLVDQRIITSPEGKSMLIPISKELSDSAVTLVEPWACVEDAYVSPERRCIDKTGKMLIITDAAPDKKNLEKLFKKYNSPAELVWLSDKPAPKPNCEIRKVSDVSQIAQETFNDILYFGNNPETIEKLFDLLGAKGIINIVQCGQKLGKTVKIPVGRTHYGGIRIIGTPTDDPCESFSYIPETGEIRAGDKINIIGAAGPMGVMHVVRNLCQGIEDISIYAGDMDDKRLKALSKVAEPAAQKNNVKYVSYNPKNDKIENDFDYIALMVPSAKIAASTVTTVNPNAVINIFAGISADIKEDIELDTYIKNKLYFIGTSGSTIDDMEIVLKKVESGTMDTNVSVAAVSDLESAVEGIRAVENRSVAGKIIVYPKCKGLGLLSLEQLSEKFPNVGDKIKNGVWTKQAETELLKNFK